MKSNASVERRVFFDHTRAFHWTEKNVIDFVESAIKSGSHACFAFVRGKKVNQHNNGCFGMMHSYPLEDDSGWGVALKYRSMNELDGIPNESELWFNEKVLLHPKYSPWRALLPALVIVRNKNGVPIAALADDNNKTKVIDKGLLQNFNIASRSSFENPDMVASIHAFYKSGLVNKREAVLLRGVFNVSPVTGLITTTYASPHQSGFGTQFLHSDNYLRFLEGAPNSSMVAKDRRHVPADKSMSSDNDRYIWGMDGRSYFDIGTFLKKPVKTTALSTFFGATVQMIEAKEVKAWIAEFRKIYQEELKKKPRGHEGVVPEYNEDEDDIWNDED